jgi:PAS domain-containing protein
MDSVWKIVDRRITLSAFRDSETKLRSLIDATQDIVLLKDKDFKHVMVNQAAQQFFHRTEKEIIGKTDFDLLQRRVPGLVDYPIKKLLKKLLWLSYMSKFISIFRSSQISGTFKRSNWNRLFYHRYYKNRSKPMSHCCFNPMSWKAVANAVVITDPDGK